MPESFSWLDHRLIRDGHLLRLERGEILLYFFLVLVGDRDGLSYYSTRSIERYLKLPPDEIVRARAALCARGLIAHEAPLYQVLALPPRPESATPPTAAPAPRSGKTRSLGEILDGILGREARRG